MKNLPTNPTPDRLSTVHLFFSSEPLPAELTDEGMYNSLDESMNGEYFLQRVDERTIIFIDYTDELYGEGHEFIENLLALDLTNFHHYIYRLHDIWHKPRPE